MKLKLYIKDSTTGSTISGVNVCIQEIASEGEIITFTSSSRYKSLDLSPGTYSLAVNTNNVDYDAIDPITLLVSEDITIQVSSDVSAQVKDDSIEIKLSPKIADGPYINPHMVDDVVAPSTAVTQDSEESDENNEGSDEADATVQDIDNSEVTQVQDVYIPASSAIILNSGTHTYKLSNIKLKCRQNLGREVLVECKLKAGNNIIGTVSRSILAQFM